MPRARLTPLEITKQRLSLARSLEIVDLVDKKLLASHEQMDLATVPALKLLCDNQWRRINKLLPDLKAQDVKVEHSGTIEVNWDPKR